MKKISLLIALITSVALVSMPRPNKIDPGAYNAKQAAAKAASKHLAGLRKKAANSAKWEEGHGKNQGVGHQPANAGQMPDSDSE